MNLLFIGALSQTTWGGNSSTSRMDLGSYDPSRSKTASVFFHSAFTLFSDVSVQYPDWLNMYVWLTASVWSTGCYCMCSVCGHHLLLTCLCVFYCQTRVSHSQARPQPPPSPIPHPDRQNIKPASSSRFIPHTCFDDELLIDPHPPWTPPPPPPQLCYKDGENKQTFHWTLFLWQRKVYIIASWTLPADPSPLVWYHTV